MVRPEYLYRIIDNKIVDFEIVKEFDSFYGCIYYIDNDWHTKYISKKDIRKEYFLSYKTCEKKLKEVNKHEKKIAS